MFYSNTPTQH